MRVIAAALALFLASAIGRAEPAAAAPSGATAPSEVPLAPADGNAVLYPAGSGAAAAKPAATGWSGGTVAFLVVVLGAAGGWMLWNKVRGAGPLSRGEHALAITETRSLGNRQFLVVAAYENRKFLLGVCPGRIDLLAPLDGGPGGERPPS